MSLTEAQALLDTLAAEAGADHVRFERNYISVTGRVVYTFSIHHGDLVRSGHSESLEAARDIALAAEPFNARKAMEEAA